MRGFAGYIPIRNIYTLCVETGMSSLTRTIPLRSTYTSCVVTGARIGRIYSYTEYIHTVCSHGVSSFTRTIPVRNIYTPFVVTRVMIYRLYSYTGYRNAVCSHGGVFSSPGLFLLGICIRRVEPREGGFARYIPLQNIYTPYVVCTLIFFPRDPFLGLGIYEEVDKAITREQSGPNTIQWIDSMGNPTAVGNEMTARGLEHKVIREERGLMIGDIHELSFRDPNHFSRLGTCTLNTRFGRVLQIDVLKWQHCKGSLKGEHYDSDRPPPKMFRNNMSCKPFVSFVQKTRLGTGAISLVGRVGEVAPPHITITNR